MFQTTNQQQYFYHGPPKFCLLLNEHPQKKTIGRSTINHIPIRAIKFII